MKLFEPGSLWSYKGYRLFWFSNAIFVLGASAFPIALAVTVLDAGGTATSLGLILGARVLSGVVFAPFAGVWADRVNRKTMIIAADAAISVSTLGLAFLMLSGVDDLWLIFLVMAVRSFGAGVQSPAISALMPQIVPTEKLMRVNGINSSVQSSLTLLAPIAAAAVYANFSLVGILFIDVVTAIIGVTLLATVAVPTLARAANLEKPSYFADLKEGINYTFTHDLVRWVIAIFGIVFVLIVAPSNL